MLEKSSNGNGVTNNINGNLNDTEELSNFGIVISNATAKWSDTQTDNTLDNINLSVKPGRLAAIIGPVGAGKVNINNQNYIFGFASNYTHIPFYRVH